MLISANLDAITSTLSNYLDLIVDFIYNYLLIPLSVLLTIYTSGGWFYEKYKYKKKILKEQLENRKSFVETGIIKMNDEFEPVIVHSTKNYDFKLDGNTVSLIAGESLVIPRPIPNGFDYLLIVGWGCAWKDETFFGDLESKEVLGNFIFINDKQDEIKNLPIVLPDWTKCGRTNNCIDCEDHACIKLLDANPDPTYGGDPPITELLKTGILGKIKSYYTNIHTQWIDLNIYVSHIKIPPDAKYLKISLEKQNEDITQISLNIAELFPVTTEEYFEIKESFKKEEKHSPSIENDDDVKKLFGLYKMLRNGGKNPNIDELLNSVDKYLQNDIYRSSKLLKYALSFRESLIEERIMGLFEKVVKNLNMKVENEKDIRSCCLLAHLSNCAAKFDPTNRDNHETMAVKHMVKAGELMEEVYEKNQVKYYAKYMNLQWRCYESSARKYGELSDYQNAFDLRVELNRVFKRINKKHPFTSPIVDNILENFDETAKIIREYLDHMNKK